MAVLLVCTALAGAAPTGAASDSALLRYTDPPVVVSTAGGREWRASVDCAPPVSLAALIGARVGFAFDFDLDGLADAADSLGISPADCGESAPGRITLRRRVPPPAANGGTQGAFPPAHDAAVLRATLRTAADTIADARAVLTAGAGSMLRIARFCARPKNGEPEWVEFRNVTPRALSLARVRFDGRALAGSLAPGESVVAGGDTAELRVWQPGARIVPLSSWSNLRNSGDTLRLTLGGDFVAPIPVPAAAALLTLDSLVYGAGGHAAEACASTGDEDAAAGAAGYVLEFSTPRGVRAERGRVSSSEGFTVTVRAPANGRYDLTVYDLDGRPLCVLAHDAAGPGTHALPPASFSTSGACPALASLRAGRVIFHLAPRNAPGLRALLRVVP